MAAHEGTRVTLPQPEASGKQGLCSMPTLTLDVVQDHPAAWDWRLIFGFVVAGIGALYLL